MLSHLGNLFPVTLELLSENDLARQDDQLNGRWRLRCMLSHLGNLFPVT